MTKHSKPLLRALSGEVEAPPPIWMMRQAGRYLPEYRELRKAATNFLHFCYTPKMAVEATLQPLRRFPLSAAILFSDILTIPDALGQKVEFVTGDGPQLEPIRDAAAIPRLNPETFDAHYVPVYEAISKLRQELAPETALIGFAGAPWTLACYMVDGRGTRDFAETRRWAFGSPNEFGQLMDVVTEAVGRLLVGQIDHGAETVQLFDSWAGVLPADEFKKWVIEPTKKIVAQIKSAHPNTPIIGFPRNAGPLYESYARETGVDAISIDATLPLDWVRDTLQPHVAIQGNLDNIALLTGGDAMLNRVDEILAALAGGPFVFNLGHGVMPPTPPEHVQMVCDRVLAYAG
jgi:uroporphyrinogen decarboxylase